MQETKCTHPDTLTLVKSITTKSQYHYRRRRHLRHYRCYRHNYHHHRHHRGSPCSNLWINASAGTGLNVGTFANGVCARARARARVCVCALCFVICALCFVWECAREKVCACVGGARARALGRAGGRGGDYCLLAMNCARKYYILYFAIITRKPHLPSPQLPSPHSPSPHYTSFTSWPAPLMVANLKSLETPLRDARESELKRGKSNY